MTRASGLDQIAAWSTFATAFATLGLFVFAICAWRVAVGTMRESRRASEAAIAAARAAEAANEQTIRDSIERTRPNVFVEVIPGMAGMRTWDIRITNAGASSAVELTLEFDSWPQEPDDVASALQKMFRTPRVLPPGCSLRVMWRLEGHFTDGTTEAGVGRSGNVTARYSSNDPSQPLYSDRFDVNIDGSGLWPVGEEGPQLDGQQQPSAKQFYKLGQVLVRRLGELSRWR